MKKLVFSFLVGVVIVVLATSCNQRQQVQSDLKLSVKLDTTIMYPVPETSPLWTCDGKKASYDKLLSMDSVPVVISLKKDTIIAGKNLPVVPVKSAKVQKSGAGVDLGWIWQALSFILGAILIILALGLLAYLVLWLLKQLRNQTEDNNHAGTGNEARPETQVAPVMPVTPGGGQNQHTESIFNNQLSAGQALIGNQPIHEFIQEAEGKADGSWKSTIRITTKNEPKKI